MNSLLKHAIEAHGSLDRWNQLSSLIASVSVTGAIWQIKGKPDTLKDIRLELSLHLERVVTHFVGQNRRFFFTRSRVAIEDEQGRTLASRDNPRTMFDGQSFESQWDDLQVAYFNSYALWTYLTIPFLYAHPAFVTEELPPWREDGEQWRPLRAVFPSTIASHCQQQVSYFGPDGLPNTGDELQRMAETWNQALERLEGSVKRIRREPLMQGCRRSFWASSFRSQLEFPVFYSRQIF